MRHLLAATALATATLAFATPATAQSGNQRTDAQGEEARFDAAQRRFETEYASFQAAWERYRQWRARNPSRDDRGPGRNGDRNDRWDNEDDYRDDPNYDPARYYRSGSNYQERALGANERVYRGNDGRYYCRRSDGTTGLVVGAAAGGAAANATANTRSSTVQSILNALTGGASNTAQRNQEVRCR